MEKSTVKDFCHLIYKTLQNKQLTLYLACNRIPILMFIKTLPDW